MYRFTPKEGTTITLYGQFVTPPINVCVVDGTLYSFSHDDFFDGQVVEAMELGKGDPLDGPTVEAVRQCRRDQNIKDEDENSGTKNMNEDNNEDSKVVPPLSLLVRSKEVWRGNDPGRHMFTTLCPSESTYSLGSFPLLNVLV